MKHLSLKFCARTTQGSSTKAQGRAVLGRLWGSLLSAAVLYDGHIRPSAHFGTWSKQESCQMNIRPKIVPPQQASLRDTV